MCLAVPCRLVEVLSEAGLLMGRVDLGGVFRQICLEYVPFAAPGDYLLIHVGFALARIDEAEAARMLELLGTTGDLDEARRDSG
jgi:hydrogenase expression/formation protein HypC